MIENTTTKQFYPGPILNDTLEITNFLFRDPEQVKLTKTIVDETGSQDIELTYGIDYEVKKVLADDITIEDANLTASTGQVVLKSHIHVGEGEKLTAYRESNLVQSVDYPRTGKFPAASHEGALDYLTMQNQEQQEQIDRSLKIPISVGDFNAQMPIPVAGKALKIDETGTHFALSDLDVDAAYETIEQYKIETVNAKDEAIAQAEAASQSADSAAASKSAAASSENAAANSATQAKNTLDSAVEVIASTKTAALNDLDTNRANSINEITNTTNTALTDITTAKDNSIKDINTNRTSAVGMINSVGNTFVNTFANYKNEISTAKENAEDFYQKAVGWDIDYETDGTEDCLVFKDRSSNEINQAKNYIEDTRDKALDQINNTTSAGLTSIDTTTTNSVNSINQAKTLAVNAVENTRDSVVSSVTNAGDEALTNIADAKTSALNSVEGVRASVVNDVKTTGNTAIDDIDTAATTAKSTALNDITAARQYAVNIVNNAPATNINNATADGLRDISAAKIDAVRACTEQVALAKEYAQMANGWNFNYDENTQTLVFIENKGEAV